MAEIWGAAIAGGAVLGGALLSSNASSNAASTQAAAANNAAQIQEQEFDTVQNLNAPSRNLGYGADSILASLYGIPNPNSPFTTAGYPANSAAGITPGQPGVTYNTTTAPGGTGVAYPNLTTGGNPNTVQVPNGSAGSPNYSSFYNSPGYQFTLSQGEQAINRAAAAGGNAYSTNTLANLNNYAQGAASTQYNNYVQQMLSLAGLGGQAVAGTGSAALQTGANISNATMQAGAANASGILNSNAAITGALNSPLLSSAASGLGTGIAQWWNSPASNFNTSGGAGTID